ncbi:MAG: hypothetical protein MJZ42_00340 [Bacteroidales bacterium]|nr:hypothetical protein [Bacteroidales bacterium]
MPANKNAVTRYFILDQLLANRYHNYTITDLMKAVNEHLSELGMDPFPNAPLNTTSNILNMKVLFLPK